MKEFYEIVIFTAATQDYADWILDVIDQKKCISHRLYRDHTMTRGPHCLKVEIFNIFIFFFFIIIFNFLMIFRICQNWDEI